VRELQVSAVCAGGAACAYVCVARLPASHGPSPTTAPCPHEADPCLASPPPRTRLPVTVEVDVSEALQRQVGHSRVRASHTQLLSGVLALASPRQAHGHVAAGRSCPQGLSRHTAALAVVAVDMNTGARVVPGELGIPQPRLEGPYFEVGGGGVWGCGADAAGGMMRGRGLGCGGVKERGA
jgi:hypothetical protein